MTDGTTADRQNAVEPVRDHRRQADVAGEPTESQIETERREATSTSGRSGPRHMVAKGAAHGTRGTVFGLRTIGGLLAWIVGRVIPFDHPLLRQDAFRAFWLSRIAVQTAQGALLYTLLIVVADRTDATFYNALFVACSIVPSIIFGLPGGIVVDAMPRRPLMLSLNLLRFVFVFLLFVREPALGGIFAATLGIWVIHQFYSPSESAVVAALVRPERFVAAQALSNLALTLAQLVGLVILAPILLKLAGPRAVYGACSIIFAVAAVLTAFLPPLDNHLPTSRHHRSRTQPDLRTRQPRSLRSGWTALLNGWAIVRRDRIAFEALADDMLVGIGLTSLVVIMPVYLERVLGTAKENTVFVFAPAALGLVVGLRVAPLAGNLLGERRVATLSLITFAVIIGALGFVERLEHVLDDRLRLPLSEIADIAGLAPLIFLAMLLSVPSGFASALVGVATRSILLNRTPPAARGQVVATQNLIGNLVALIPTLLTGAVADIVGVEPIAVAVAVVMLGGALLAHTVYREPVPGLVVGRQ
jgi:MFS family permease